MSSTEHRRHERHPVAVPLVFQDAVALRKEMTENISRSGLFVRTNRLMERGEMVTLTIELPDTHEKLEIDGTVEYHQHANQQHPEGFGIQFIALSPAGWQSLDAFVNRLERHN